MRIKEEMLTKDVPKWFEKVDEAAHREFGDSDFCVEGAYKGIVFCSMIGVDGWQFKSMAKICDEQDIKIDIAPGNAYAVRGMIYRNEDTARFYDILDEVVKMEAQGAVR